MLIVLLYLSMIRVRKNDFDCAKENSACQILVLL